MANKKKNQRHLTLTDRTYIEQELVRGSNFTEIGKALRKDPSTIAKEVKLHYEVRKSSYNAYGCANCVIYADCIKQHLLHLLLTPPISGDRIPQKSMILGRT